MLPIPSKKLTMADMASHAEQEMEVAENAGTHDLVEQNEEEKNDPLIDEEYRAWKKNTPFLYDMIMTHSLVWPSLTVEWTKDAILRDDKMVHRMVLGTHTGCNDPNYLIVADVSLPVSEREIDSKKYDVDSGEVGGYGGSVSKVTTKIEMAHDGEINRARVNPFCDFMIATKSPLSSVFVFDYRKHSSIKKETTPKPEHTLLGHSLEGYGLCWSPLEKNRLLSGSDDATICLWDLTEAGQQVNAMSTWKGHKDVVEDVDWHRFSNHIFGSVGDDSSLMIWDTRRGGEGAAVKNMQNAHNGDVNCLSFNPFNENFVATGGGDGLIKVWDLRYDKEAVCDLEKHTEGVYQLSWSPHSETIIASGSADRRVCVWDLHKIGAEQTPEEAKDGPAELIFIHGGHTSKISDLSWNKNKPWTMASVSEGNIMQVWSMSESHYIRDKSTAGGMAKGGDHDMDDQDLE